MKKHKNDIKYPPCDSYGDQAYSSYVQQLMPELDINAFELHAVNCSSCLQGIRKATLVNLNRKEKAENEILFKRTLSLMDKLDQSVFSIVIRAVQGMVELIRSTGEQMSMTPAFAGMRSSDSSETCVSEPLRLVKEFEESCLSVEVVISPFEPDMLDMVVSLLDQQHEEFIPGVTVTCQGGDILLEETTDANGQAFFRVPAAGFYELVMKKDTHLLGEMTLTGL